MRLLFARHAPTDWNGKGRYQGHEDIALGAAGRRQAALLAGRLAAERIDEVHASDLCRARETANAVSGRHRLPLRSDSRLRELHFGAWEGLTREEVRQGSPEALAAWEADTLRTSPPGGETLAQLTDRVGAFLATLTKDAALDRTVFVVGHKGSLQVLLCLALGLPPESRWKFCLEPASLSELNLYAEGAVLTSLNDVHHLREMAHVG
jgi:broad specificity phosphatase PhoE